MKTYTTILVTVALLCLSASPPLMAQNGAVTDAQTGEVPLHEGAPSANILTKLKALHEKPVTYQFFMSQKSPSRDHKMDVEVLVEAKEEVQVDEHGSLVKAVVQIKTIGKGDASFPPSFTLVFTAQGIAVRGIAGQTTSSIGPGAEFLNQLFMDFVLKKESPDFSWREAFHEGDFLLACSLMGMKLGSLKYGRTADSLLEFEALPSWGKKQPKWETPTSARFGVFAADDFEPPLSGTVVLSNQTLLPERVELQADMTMEGGSTVKETHFVVRLLRKK